MAVSEDVRCPECKKRIATVDEKKRHRPKGSTHVWTSSTTLRVVCKACGNAADINTLDSRATTAVNCW